MIHFLTAYFDLLWQPDKNGVFLIGSNSIIGTLQDLLSYLSGRRKKDENARLTHLIQLFYRIQKRTHLR